MAHSFQFVLTCVTGNDGGLDVYPVFGLLWEKSFNIAL